MLYLFGVFFKDAWRESAVVKKIRKLGNAARNSSLGQQFLSRASGRDSGGTAFTSGGSQPGTAEATDRELEMTVLRTKRANDQSGDHNKTNISTKKMGRTAHKRTRELPQQPKLPEGWRRVMDATDSAGKYYYINGHTEETQWEVPTAPARPAAHSRKVTHMPEGWRKLFTDEGVGYYVDPENKTQWEKPPGND